MTDKEIATTEKLVFDTTNPSDLEMRLRIIVTFIRQDTKLTPKAVFTDWIERAYIEAGR